MAKAKKVVKKAKKGKKKQKQSKFLPLFLLMLIVMSMMFMSTALIFFIGLLPMFVAFFVDRSKKKTKAITVGAMNIAGCAPFIMELWQGDPSMEKAVSIIADPMAIIVIYSAAGIGYIIDWAMSLLVASVLYQRGASRKKAIEERQKELIERWGEEVTGQIPLDHEGFPVDPESPAPAAPAKS